MRISRMVKPKSKRTDLNVDDWVKKNGKQETKTCWRTCLPKRTLTRIGLGVVSRCILSYVFPQLLAIACLATAGFQLALSFYYFFACRSLSISHTISQEEWLNQLTIIVRRNRRSSCLWTRVGIPKKIVSSLVGPSYFSVLCEGVSIYDIYCRYAKQKMVVLF